jgi:hypothetical protein
MEALRLAHHANERNIKASLKAAREAASATPLNLKLAAEKQADAENLQARSLRLSGELQAAHTSYRALLALESEARGRLTNPPCT